MKYIDISWNLIAGLMVGAEYIADEEDRAIVVDLFIVRLVVCWGEV